MAVEARVAELMKMLDEHGMRRWCTGTDESSQHIRQAKAHDAEAVRLRAAFESALRAALSRPQEVATPVRARLSDDEVIAQAKAAGFTYLPPDPDIDGDGAGFPGGFDLQHGLESMRRLLSASHAPVAVGVEPSFNGPNKWTDEEVADGHRGIRWITAEGVQGRPTSHDVMEYLQQRGEAAYCGCDRCKAFFVTPSPGAGGSVGSVCAPFPGMNEPWTEEKKAELKTVLADVFGWQVATPAPSVPLGGGEGQHLFEFWWAEYMPTATQARAWEAWQAAPQARNVGVAIQAQDATQVEPKYQQYEFETNCAQGSCAAPTTGCPKGKCWVRLNPQPTAGNVVFASNVSVAPVPAGVQGDAAREVTDAERLAFLHGSNQDPEGYEYGVCRVKVTDGSVSYLWTASDHSDIDAIILKQKGCAHRFATFNNNPNRRCMDCGIYQSTAEAALATQDRRQVCDSPTPFEGSKALTQLRFFRDLSEHQRVSLFSQFKAIPEGAENEVKSHTIEHTLFNFVWKSPQRDEFAQAIDAAIAQSTKKGA